MLLSYLLKHSSEVSSCAPFWVRAARCRVANAKRVASRLGLQPVARLVGALLFFDGDQLLTASEEHEEAQDHVTDAPHKQKECHAQASAESSARALGVV